MCLCGGSSIRNSFYLIVWNGRVKMRVASVVPPMALLLTPASSFLFRSDQKASRFSSVLRMAGKEIEVISQPSKGFLEQKGVFSWGTWGCDASTFPWTYSDNESCYLLKGQVTVTPTDGRKPATFGKGDFVTFPAGMSCTWEVSEAVSKHFLFF